jgi:hypothetical protein
VQPWNVRKEGGAHSPEVFSVAPLIMFNRINKMFFACGPATASTSAGMGANRLRTLSAASEETDGVTRAIFGFAQKYSLAAGMNGVAMLLFLFSVATTVQGQEAVRMSMASAEAAEARRKASSTPGFYNLKLGPTAWRFGASLQTEYNDNVNLNANRSEDDVIFRPQVNTQVLWPLTDQNSLNLKVGGGYSAYVEHSELNRAFIAPGSELSFDTYVGDFWINLHDRFSITQNAYEDPTVTGSGDYARLENALGVATLWDLNKVIVRVGYDHVNYLSVSGGNRAPDGQSEVFSASIGYAIKPQMLAGVEVGGSLLQYDGNTPVTSADQWNTGVFFETPVSEHIHFRGSVGYTEYTPDGRGIRGGSEFSGVYAQLAVRHAVNQYLDYSLTGGRSLNFAFFGGTVDLYYARLHADWKLVEKVSIGTALDYEHGSQVGFGTETFDRYGAGISFGRPITERLSANLGYRFYLRESDLSGRDYTVNVVSLNLNYDF